MNTALETKLKCAGPLLDFDSEMQRFLFWLPPSIRPLLVLFRDWQQRYRQAGKPIERIEIEQQAVRDLRQYLVHIPEYPFLVEFMAHAENALVTSAKSRRHALEGKTIDRHLDDKLFDGLLAWLAGYHPGPYQDIAGWLARLLMAWKNERETGDQLPKHSRPTSKL